MARNAERKRERDRRWNREWRQRRVAVERNGPLPAKRCQCETPWNQRDEDGERWCVRCGRLA